MPSSLWSIAKMINQTDTTSIHKIHEPNMNYSAIIPCHTAVAPLSEHNTNAPIRIFSFGNEPVVARAKR